MHSAAALAPGLVSCEGQPPWAAYLPPPLWPLTAGSHSAEMRGTQVPKVDPNSTVEPQLAAFPSHLVPCPLTQGALVAAALFQSLVHCGHWSWALQAWGLTHRRPAHGFTCPEVWVQGVDRGLCLAEDCVVAQRAAPEAAHGPEELGR